MDRCALFVDAGYALGDGALAAVGTGNRDSVSWDYVGLVKLLSDLSADGTGLPLLRCYWYDVAATGNRTDEHDLLGDLPGLKVRLRKPRPGRTDGVEAEICKDLATLARNRAVSDVVIASAAEDVAPVIAEVQELGLRTLLLQVATDSTAGDQRHSAETRALRQEFDEVIEIATDQLRPLVKLIARAKPQVRELPVGTGQVSGSPAVIETPAPRVIAAARPVAPERAPQLATVGAANVGAANVGAGNGGADRAADFHAGQHRGAVSPGEPQQPVQVADQQALGSGPDGGPQPSVAAAIQSAHAEGFGFGQGVARDAPALWLEAVLARKPRMPSDLEAKLLQGSALPIDSLLHDDVRHALRRGFWDAMERSRR
ncbi:MAG: NYN domain-containing protein [Actinobacteria bacterium]|nr:NYN domain-containing protein [Actinomycetota bacterium]